MKLFGLPVIGMSTGATSSPGGGDDTRPLTELVARVWWAGFLLFAIVVGSFVALLVSSDRDSVLRAAEARTTGLSRIFVAHAESAIEDSEKLIRAVKPMVQAWNGSDAAVARSIFDEMKHTMIGSPQLSSAWVMDRDGVSILDTSGMPSQRVPAGDRRYFRLHAEGADFVIVGQERGINTGRWRFTVSLAVREPDKRLKYVIVTGVDSGYFASLYAEAANWPDAQAGIFLADSSGSTEVLARMESSAVPSPPFVSELNARVRAAPSGSATVYDDGKPRLVGWHRSEKYTNLFAATSQSVDAALGAWLMRSIAIGSMAAFSAAAFLVLGGFVTRAGRAQREAARQQILLREVHHRVKNNLSIVASLIRMSVRQTTDENARAQFGRIEAHVIGVAKLYDVMQEASLGEGVEVNKLIGDLCQALSRSTGSKITFVPGPKMHRDPDSLVTLVIALNELITNSIKHAAREIRVLCGGGESGLVVEVSDDGPGFPPGFEVADSKGFGLRLAHQLLASAGGSLRIVSCVPASIAVHMPPVQQAGSVEPRPE